MFESIKKFNPIFRFEFTHVILSNSLGIGFFIIRKMAYNFGRWDSPLKRICNKCKKKFTARSGKQRRCNNCKKIEALNKPQLIKKKCKMCGKKYNTGWKLQRFCSNSCRIEYGREYQKKRNQNNPQNITLKAFTVFERDNFRCAYCGKTSYEDNVKLIVEHIFPRDKGGTNESHNIITACSDCNVRKGTKIMDWNVILTLWQIVDKRNKDKNIDWNSLKEVFDKQYKINQT